MFHFIYIHYLFHRNSYKCYEFSNSEITKYARRFFEQRLPTHITNFNTGRFTNNPEDILLGHPTWGSAALTDDWVKANALEEQAEAHPNTYIITPWVPVFPPEWHFPFLESQFTAARKIIALCGHIWYGKTMALGSDSLQGKMKNKITRVNMGVAAELLPVKPINAPRNRKNFLHISNLASYKRPVLLLESLHGIDHTLYIGSKALNKKGPVTLNLTRDTQGTPVRVSHQIHSLGDIDNNDAEFNTFVINNCDFYIHTSDYDAQATTVLENCARGLVPLVTPESGFNCPYAIYLTDSADKNRNIIQNAIDMSDSEYAERSVGVRRHVLKHNNWDGIYSRIWEAIQADQHDLPFDNEGGME
jgi:hypothetical protein